MNFPACKILAFIDAEGGGSEVVLDSRLTYTVEESPLSIRNAMKKLDSGNAE